MKFYLDSADLDEIRQASRLGILDGVTTNPSLIKDAGNVDFHEHVFRICESVDGEVFAEVTATEFDGIMEEAHALHQIHDAVVVKIPLVEAGIRALRPLGDDGIRTACTLCFSVNQALAAAKAGATYVSPFLGRLEDVSTDGTAVLEEIVQILDTHDYDTEVLVASIRTPNHVKRAALAGADAATMPPEVFTQMLDHPLTERGLRQFREDWEAYKEARKAEAGL